MMVITFNSMGIATPLTAEIKQVYMEITFNDKEKIFPLDVLVTEWTDKKINENNVFKYFNYAAFRDVKK